LQEDPISKPDAGLLTSLRLSPKLTGDGWTLTAVGSHGTAQDTVFSARLNAHLADGGPVHFKMSPNCFSPDDGWLLRRRVEELRSAGKKLFDSPKIRLVDDPVPGLPARVMQTTYFNGLVTNELCLRSYRLSQEHVLDGTGRAFPDCEVPRLADSMMSNHIGACSLAFDTDGVLCLCETGAASAVSAGKLSPSAAGSLDMEDLHAASSLTEAVCAALSRELSEETGLDSSAEVETRVIAFARHLERGGKPEFVGVSKIPGRWSDLCGRLDQSEADYTSGHVFVNLMSEGSDTVDEWMLRNRGRASYALLTSWHFLKEELGREDSPVRDFVGL
jgi:hypothetical protein